MKVTRTQLIRIIKEELARHASTLLEKDVNVVDGDDDRSEKEKRGKAETKPQNDPDNTSGKPKTNGSPSPDKGKDGGDKKKPASPAASSGKPKDPAGSKGLSLKAPPVPEPMEEPGVSAAQDTEADANGQGVGDQVVGKSILSFTANPNSPYVPGGTELTIQFMKDPNPFRILISNQGQLRYMYKDNQPLASLDGMGEEE